MKRSHVSHTRDNRRYHPSHFGRDARDDRDPRTLAWRSDCDRQIMLLDGVPVATVEPTGDVCVSPFDLDASTPEHVAHIHGERIEIAPRFNDCDAARLHCEAHFSRS
jgi:hypothetical protein